MTWLNEIGEIIKKKISDSYEGLFPLNSAQKEAIKMIWRSSLFPKMKRTRPGPIMEYIKTWYNQAIPIYHQEYSGYIIIGPPGTGKTTVISYGALLYVSKPQYARSTARIFLCTSTNYGADRICEKIVDILKENGIMGWENQIKRVIAKNVGEEEISKKIRFLIIKPQCPANETKSEHLQRLKNVIIFIGTIYACQDLLNLRLGDHNSNKTPILSQAILFDEASQLTPPQMYLPISYNTSLRSFGVVGDNCQLPPISSIESLNYSCIDYLRGLEGYNNSRLSVDKQNTLNIQYRMHPAIRDISAGFANRDTLIKDGPNVKKRNYLMTDYNQEYIESHIYSNLLKELFRPQKTVVTIDTQNLDIISLDEKVRSSRINQSEIIIINGLTILLKDVYPLFEINDESLKIVTPYKPQANELKRVTQLNAGTVDSFQGQEAAVVLYSITFAEPDIKSKFAQNIHRLHVALSRAQKKLFIVGNSEGMRHPTFLELKQKIFQYQYQHSINGNIDLGYDPVCHFRIKKDFYNFLQSL